VKNDAGEVIELRCTWDPESRGGNAEGRTQGQGHAALGVCEKRVPAEVRLYDRLFKTEHPGGRGEVTSSPDLNPGSCETW
jgi:glutaminyl-tRNA synthetase